MRALLAAALLGAPLAGTETAGGPSADVAEAPRVDDERGQGSGGAAPALSAQRASLSSAAAERAVAAGLDYLAQQQQRTRDGSFSVADAEEQGRLGVSALCALAFLAAGNQPGRGTHGEAVERAVDYLMLHADLAPDSPHRGYISAQGDTISQTHGHGYATLVLAEVYGMSPGSERIREALVAAVERIQVSQGSEGGWNYEPVAVPQHEGSVTVCYAHALRAAHNAGIQVDFGVIRRADDYVRRLQDDTGLFAYTLNDRRTSVALTAASISTLNATGTYDDPAIKNGVDAIWSKLQLREESGEDPHFPEYERLYLAQAFWQLSDTSHFERWYERERERLLRTQDRDGSWPSRRFGRAYATAVNCLVLSLPDAALPILQR